MKDSLIIRDATSADLTVLKQFEQEIIKSERPFDPSLAPDPISYYDLAQYIERKDVKVLVAQVNKKLVASGYALTKKALHYLDHETYGYLGFMYTLPEYRGRGINGKITEALKKWCGNRGLTEVRLTVYYDNRPAVRAYEKVGFKNHLTEMRIRLAE